VKARHVRERQGATHYNQPASDRNKTTYPRIMSQDSRYRVGKRPFIKYVKISSVNSSHETSKSFHRVHLQNCFNRINCYTNGDRSTSGENRIHALDISKYLIHSRNLRIRTILQRPTNTLATIVVRPGPQSFVYSMLINNVSTPSLAAVLTNRAKGAWINANLKPEYNLQQWN
jgi:hypothetical protein